jgi:hypothetical protein
VESDEYRCTPEGKLRVYRTRNAGESWEPMTSGLPQKNALETILRDSMATDMLDPAGIYFGTRSGKVYGSSNEGKSWDVVIEGLPPVVCVRAVVVGDGAGSTRSSGGAAKTKARGGTASTTTKMSAKSSAARNTKAAARKCSSKKDARRSR